MLIICRRKLLIKKGELTMFKKIDDKETKGKIGFLSGIIMGIALVILVFFLFLLITAWI